MNNSRSGLEESAIAQFDTARMHKGSGGCPISDLAAGFNPFAGAFLNDPYAYLAPALEQEPVFYSPEIDHWVITRYDDVREVFQDFDNWSAANTLSAVTPMSSRVQTFLRERNFRMNPVLTNLDPPAHARIRKHATNAFSSKHVSASEGWIRELVDDAIDQLLAKAPDLDGVCHADMVRDFAYDLPAHVAFRFLGVPDEMVPDIKCWTKNRVALTWGRCEEEAQLDEADGLVCMWKFCEQHVATMLEREDHSFLGDLARVHRSDPTQLTVNEIESILFTMLVAGHETTTSALSNSLVTLLSKRELWESLIEDAELIPNAVEELLRHRPSIISWRRIAKRDLVFRGQRIPEGGRVLLMIASANNDPERFPEPDEVNFGREDAKKHMSFGHGVHLCIGAGLARLELKVVFQQLLRRIPGMRLDAQDFEYSPNLSFRGPSRLLVCW